MGSRCHGEDRMTVQGPPEQGSRWRSPGARWRLFTHEAASVSSLPAWVYVALFTLAQWIDQISGLIHGSGTYWLSGGVMAAAVLRLNRRPAMIVLIAGLVISLIAGIASGHSGLFSLLMAAVDLGSAMLVVVLARRVCGAAADVSRPRRLMRFFLWAAIPASVVSAALHFGIQDAVRGLGTAESFLDLSYQFIAHLLSLLLVTPVLLMLSQYNPSERMIRDHGLVTLGQLVLIAAATALVFLQSTAPVMFLAIPPLLFLAFRQPPRVVGLGLILMAAISGAATGAGYGPVHMLPIMNAFGLEGLSPTLQQFGLYNLFLVSVVISIIPVSSVMSEQRRIMARLKMRTVELRRASAKAASAADSLQTERNANAEKETFYQTLVELMPAFLIVKRASDGTFILINSAAKDALGLDPVTCIGKTVADIFPGEEAAVSAAEDRLVIETRSMVTDVDATITTSRGEQKHYSTRKIALFDEHVATYIVTAGQDVTEQVEARAALEVAVEAAQKASSAKSQFLSNMSHELRTPLNGVIAMADMLLAAQQDDRSRQMAGTIIQSGRMLERVINDILDVAKIEAGQMKLESEPFDLETALVGVSNLHAAAANAKGIALECLIDPAVAGSYLGDRTRVGQIVSNLLSNAVKFTVQGVIRVSVRQGRGGLRILVSDTGPGFDQATGRRLFDRFEQADVSTSRRHGGTGLGLSICKSFAEMMGGRIWVRSVPGKGTLFGVVLPLARAQDLEVEPDPGKSETATDQAEASNIRVLYADDHEVNRTVVTMILEPLGVDLTVVENGQEAVDAAADTAFDVILMDVQMPVMDGLTATRQIRKMEGDRGLARTPIISLTANAMPDDVKRSLDAGSDLHLPKPIRPVDLINAISNLLAEADENSGTAAAA